MRVFKVRHFARFARKERISDETLAAAIRQAESGLVDAELGGGLIKLRFSRQGSGKRGGYRTIIAYKSQERAVFLIGFAKNERDNILPEELEALKIISGAILALSEKNLNTEVSDGKYLEVRYE
jgi:hypothetical protein